MIASHCRHFHIPGVNSVRNEINYGARCARKPCQWGSVHGAGALAPALAFLILLVTPVFDNGKMSAVKKSITNPVIIGFFSVGNGAAGRRQNRQAGEQSPAAQGWDHGEHQTTLPRLCGTTAVTSSSEILYIFFVCCEIFPTKQLFLSSVWPSNRPVPAHSEEVSDCCYQSAGKEHGRHHCWLWEDWQRLYSVHQGAERRAWDLPSPWLPRGEYYKILNTDLIKTVSRVKIYNIKVILAIETLNAYFIPWLLFLERN